MRTRAWILTAAGSLWLVGCRPAIAASTAVPTLPPRSATAALAAPAPTGPAAATSLAPTEPPLAPQPSPTARPGLEATDPTTVVLAAGKPTFVEFFAFW
jgi:hypothetical protein